MIKRSEWKQSEIDFLKENYNNLTFKQIAEKIGRSFGAVSIKLKRLNLKKEKRLTNEEIAKEKNIVYLYKEKKISIPKISNLLGIGETTIWKILKRNFIHNNCRKDYAKLNPECYIKTGETLKKLYKEGKIINPMKGKDFSKEHRRNLSESQKRLHNERKKNLDISDNRLEKLTINDRVWSEKEIQFLKDNYNKMGNREMSPLLNRHFSSIKGKIRKLGLRRDKYFIRKIFSDVNKGKYVSEETRKKLGKIHLGNKLSKEHIAKLIKCHKGKHLSEEHRRKIGIGNLGKIITQETRKKLSETQKRLYKEGKKKTPKSFIELAKNRKGKSFEEIYGTKKAKNIIDSLRSLHNGKNNPFYGKHHTEKTRNKIKDVLNRLKEEGIYKMPIKDTSIELKIQNFLKQLNIEFFTHQYIKEIKHGYQCDILIPSMNFVIECDGDYWHKYPIGTEIDHIRTKELLEKGFKVLRLWEFEIKKMDLGEFEVKLKNV